MAVVREKTPPHHYSIVACVVVVLFGMGIWHKGTANPGKWVGSMAINNHIGFRCQDCHVPTGGRYSLGTTMTCSTSRCHPYLMNDLKDQEEALARARESAGGYAYTLDMDKIAHLFDLHRATGMNNNGSTCNECHREHRRDNPPFPPGFGPYDKAARASSGWRSVLAGGA